MAMRRLIAAGLAWLCAGSAAAQTSPTPQAPTPLDCFGHFTQGGFVICRTQPGAEVMVDTAAVGRADALGYVTIGFDRDAKPTARIEVREAGGRLRVGFDAAIAPRAFRVQTVTGLPQQTVTPRGAALLARIERESALKAKAFASRAVATGFREPWAWPVDGIVSSPWGAQRVLNGEAATPHYGIDIAAPAGAPIRAPASGIVALAEPDLHFEGGLVMVDHGQGLVSLYLHMSRVSVKAGDLVVQGQTLGEVGQTGRATGPHLCWRLKWRDRNLDPSLVPLAALQPARGAGGR